jgi:hypothetical protein
VSRAAQPVLLCLCLAGVAACGVSAGNSPDVAAASEAGICGTSAQPGILKVANLSPPLGSTVANQAIVHGFTVVNAPAQFNNFDLRFGPAHTAGLPTPEKPRFTMISADGSIIYQVTIETWSTAPGHVELTSSGGFQTKQGCAWAFPSPLFSYDLIAGPDGGLAREAGVSPDTPPQPIDGTQVVVYRLDAPMKYDLPALEASGGLDTSVTQDTGALIDGATTALDAALTSAIDAGAN